jgi:hypothetical protein
LGAFFFGSLPFALLVYQVFMRKWRTNVNGIPLVMLFFFGSFLFVFSGSFFGHVFAAFLLFNSLLMLEDQRPLASGVFLGLAFMTEYTMAVFGVFWCTYWLLQRKWQPMLWFFAGVLPFVFLQAYYNEYLTGSVIWSALLAAIAHFVVLCFFLEIGVEQRRSVCDVCIGFIRVCAHSAGQGHGFVSKH